MKVQGKWTQTSSSVQTPESPSENSNKFQTEQAHESSTEGPGDNQRGRSRHSAAANFIALQILYSLHTSVHQTHAHLQLSDEEAENTMTYSFPWGQLSGRSLLQAHSSTVTRGRSTQGNSIEPHSSQNSPFPLLPPTNLPFASRFVLRPSHSSEWGMN